MSLDPCIICFKHCCQDVIFCKEVPTVCPLCDSTIYDYILEPFRLPNPFAKAKECPITVVLRPSHGDFLNDFKDADNLHIGIVNSEGYIFEFDRPGLLRNDFINWQNCLSLKIIPESWTDHWDQTIEKLCNDKRWSKESYDDVNLNCFDFVLEFLKELKYNEVQCSTKEEFCSNFVIPKFLDALKFITFYRTLKDNDHFLLKQ